MTGGPREGFLVTEAVRGQGALLVDVEGERFVDELAPGLPTPSTRQALWRRASLQRDADGLRELLGDPFPLARSVAAACPAREESRGAHRRGDHPATDSALHGRHSVVGTGSGVRFELWT